jgi:hypothetical protein
MPVSKKGIQMTISAAHVTLIVLVLAGAIVAVFGGRVARLGELTYGAALLALCFLLAGIR